MTTFGHTRTRATGRRSRWCGCGGLNNSHWHKRSASATRVRPHRRAVPEGTVMAWLGALVAVTLIAFVFTDAFEAMILPRRVRRTYRLARLFYRSTWHLWRSVARLLPPARWRNGFLGIFGPLSLFVLFAVWAAGL